MSISFAGKHPYLTFSHASTFSTEYILDENGLTQCTRFQNDSPLDMPVTFALHTTFRLFFAVDIAPENVHLSVDATAEYDRDAATFLPDDSEDLCHLLKKSLESSAFIPCDTTLSRLYVIGTLREMRLTDEKTELCVRNHVRAP